MNDRSIIHALGWRCLTGIYDPVVALAARERVFKRRLIAQAAMHDGMAVLDLGCGTGTLALEVAKRYPRAGVTGLDADPEVLRRARRKATGAPIHFDRGTATALPYSDRTFDRVLSTLFFHHLTAAQKHRALGEARRVLKPGGELHIADWDRPRPWPMHALFFFVRLMDGFAVTADHAAGSMPALIAAANFSSVEHCGRLNTPAGTIGFFRAVRRDEAAVGGRYEHFEHEADIGIRGRGATPEEAFAQAAVALTAVICDPAVVAPRVCVKVACRGENLDMLFVNWIDAIVFEMATRSMLFSRFVVHITNLELDAELHGEAIDVARHQPAVEVKGATLTELYAGRDEGGPAAESPWRAQCVIDV